MRRIFVLFLFCFAYLVSCSTPDHTKLRPEFTGVDPRLVGYVKDYMDLATIKGIKFEKGVSVGFKKIKETTATGTVIGLCHYGINFREIDIDIDYFMNHRALQRQFLVFHELTHCYCYRDHDFGDGTMYPDEKLTLWVAQLAQMMSIKKQGYFDDGCALSIMHPIILDEECIKMHYNHYIEEMFNRCEPY